MAGHAIFINYRRDDTADACGRIYDRLLREFSSKAVFKDVDALPVGRDFGAYIVETLKECRVLLAVIGPGWIGAVDESGGRRLDNPRDWVRVEIETAINTPSLQIVPVLLNGARMPATDELPESLRSLSTLNAAVVRRDPDFHNDMDRLITALKEGALTGVIEVELPTSGPGAAAAHWQSLKTSSDVADLRRFAESFPNTSEGLEARRRADRLTAELTAFRAIDWSNVSTVDAFLAEWPEAPQRASVLAERDNVVARQAQRAADERARQNQRDADKKAEEERAATRADADKKAHEERMASINKLKTSITQDEEQTRRRQSQLDDEVLRAQLEREAEREISSLKSPSGSFPAALGWSAASLIVGVPLGVGLMSSGNQELGGIVMMIGSASFWVGPFVVWNLTRKRDAGRYERQKSEIYDSMNERLRVRRETVKRATT